MKKLLPVFVATTALTCILQLTSCWSASSGKNAAVNAEKSVNTSASAIVRLDARFDQLVPRDAVLEKIAVDHEWVEGPVWNRREAPNGIAFSPDEKTLYVSDADRDHVVWRAFEMKASGALGRGRIIFDATSFTKTRQGVPDGLKVDAQGNLFAAGPGGIYVITPDGEQLGWFDLGGPTGNSNWGEDGSALSQASAKACKPMERELWACSGSRTTISPLATFATTTA